MKKKFAIALLFIVCAVFCVAGLVACKSEGDGTVDVTGVTLNKTELTLNVGESEKLTVSVLPENATYTEVYWSADYENIVAVEPDGKVTAVSQGTAKVTATVKDAEAVCTVTVKKPAERVQINYDSSNTTGSYFLFAEGSENVLTAQVSPEDSTSEVVWSAEPENVIRITESGKLTAVAQGTGTVTATADGAKTSMGVIVSADGLNYDLNNDGQSYKVVSRYKGYDFTTVKVASQYNGKPVTAIGKNVFLGLEDKLKSLEIPASVTDIDFNSVYYCKSLESIVVDENNAVFTSVEGILYNKSVTEITYVPAGIKGVVAVPQTITSIADYAFDGCTKITGVKLHDGITAIGKWSFNECIGLHSITIPKNVTNIGDHAFSGCKKLWEIYNLSDLDIVTGGDVWTATHGMVGLYALNILNSEDEPSGIDYTADGYTFYTAPDKIYLADYTGSETQLDLPLDYKGNNYEIGKYAFSYCENITSVSIPYKVTAIGESAFEYCKNLVSVTVGSYVERIGDNAFDHCVSLTKITVPDSVKRIGKNAFSDCDNLTEVVLGKGITEISQAMFYYCSSLKEVTVQEGLKYIDGMSFWNCSGLEKINFSGTKEQWNDIRKFEVWDKGTAEYTVCCTDGDIVKSNN